MYPFYTGYVPDIQLNRDDVLGIQELYGGKFSLFIVIVNVVFVLLLFLILFLIVFDYCCFGYCLCSWRCFCFCYENPIMNFYV